MNTQENNKLIAEFMGMQHTDIGWYDNEETLQLQNNTFDELQFYESWDWLMPVVEKIEDMGFTTSIKTSYVRINPRENANYDHYISYITWNEDGWSSRKPHASYDDDCDMGNISYTPKEIIDKRRAIYEAVVAFINWYNKNK